MSSSRRAARCCVSSPAAPDSTCLWHALGALGYRVDALHVNHELRGAESEEDARFCREALGARDRRGARDAAPRPSCATCATRSQPDRLRATGHTASDQVETILMRLASSGTTTGIRVRRDDGVVRPLLTVWRDETEAYCRAEGLAFRVDSSNDGTQRGLIRREIVPLLRQLHPAAERNILAAWTRRPSLPRPVERALADLVASAAGSKRVDLGDGVVAVREYDQVWLERAPVALDGRFAGAAGCSSRAARVCASAAGARAIAWQGGRKKVQDLFVDAKVPRSKREAWPLVVRGDEVVSVPGHRGRARLGRRRERAEGDRMSDPAVLPDELDRGRRRDPDRRGDAPAPRRRAGRARSPRTTAAATCCSSACSRARSSSWPT